MKNRKLKGEPIPLGYYGRHQLPQLNTNPPTLASKIKRAFNLVFSFLLVGGSVIAQSPQSDIVSVVSEKKDTLFLANNALGYEIMDVWVNYPDKPIIIIKPEKWIINENTKRREKKTK